MTEAQTNPRTIALAARHAALDAEIAEEAAQLKPNDLKIQDLKRQKLAIKDELKA